MTTSFAPLPETWARARLSYLSAAPVTAGADYVASSLGEGQVRYLRTTDLAGLHALTPREDAVGVSEDAALAAPLLRGDILMTRSGSLGTSHHYRGEPACFAGYLVRWRPDTTKVETRFAAWWTSSRDHLDQITVGATRSTIDNFSASKFAAMRVPVPPITEQLAIADFLDRETAKVDSLIEKQNALVHRLRERREAVVESCLNNRGRAGPLGYFVDCLPGYAFASEDFVEEDPAGAVRLLRGVNLKPRRLEWGDAAFWADDSAQQQHRYSLASGDLVLGMDRPFVSEGTRVAVVTGDDLPALLVQRVLRLRPKRGVNALFVYYMLMTRSFKEYAIPEVTGVSVPHISDKQVRSFIAPIPVESEQDTIVQRLEMETHQIDALIAKAERFVELVRERRSALITAAVTGQIDVVGELAA